MGFIADIANSELMSSVREKLNSLISKHNGDSTNVNQFEGVNSGEDIDNSGSDGKYNVSLGVNALRDITTGNFNIGIGSAALLALTDGENNTSIGANSSPWVTGDNNTVVGQKAMSKVTDGNRNTAVGTTALEVLLSGQYLTAFGNHSQGELIIGYRNSAFGYKTLEANQFGVDNVALGYKALLILNPSGGVITAYADAGGGQVTVTSAGHGLSNGVEVTIRGTGAWVAHTYSDNYDSYYTISNVTIDTFEITATYQAIGTLNHDGIWLIEGEGKLNTAVGFQAGMTLEKGSYNILIGQNSEPDNVDGDYQLNIGDLIKGKMDSEKHVELDGSLRLVSQASDPTSPQAGEVYFNSSDSHFYGYNGSTWKQLDN